MGTARDLLALALAKRYAKDGLPAAVSDWLQDNLEPTEPPVDASLTISGAAADAKVAGDKVAELKSAITQLNTVAYTWESGLSLRPSDGRTQSQGTYSVTGFIPVGTNRTLKYRSRLTNTSLAVVCKYDKDKLFLSAVPAVNGINTGVVSGCEYVRFCKISTYSDDYILVDTIITDPHDDSILRHNVVGIDKLVGGADDVYANLIDRNKIVTGAYIDGTNGLPISNGNCAGITGFVEIVPNTQYIWQQMYGTNYAFYDENHLYISGSNSSNALTNPFTSPINAKYARFTLYSDADVRRCAISSISNLAMARNYIQHLPISAETISAITNPIHHTGKEFSVFTKCLCIGDSLTEGTFDSYDTPSVYTQISKYSYPSNLQKISGVECTNKGTSGMTTKTWYELHENDDLSGHDVCIIALGINDAYAGLESSVTETYLGYIIAKVQTENPGIRIFVVSCLPSHDHVSGYADVNTTLKSVADDTSGCYFVDMAKYSELRKKSQYVNGHLTALGYNKEAQELYSYIGWIMFTQPEGFKGIQFIGQ